MFGIPHCHSPSRLRILKSSRKSICTSLHRSVHHAMQELHGDGHRSGFLPWREASGSSPPEILQLREVYQNCVTFSKGASFIILRIIHHEQDQCFTKLFSQPCTKFTGRQRFTSLQKRHHSCSQLTLNVYCWMVGTEKVFNLALFGKHQVTSMMCL